MDIQPSEWKLETLRCRCLFHLKYFNEFCEYVSFLKFGYVPVRGRGGGRGGVGVREVRNVSFLENFAQMY